MSDFATMSPQEQQELASKLSACIKENGMDLPVETMRQEVCSLAKTTVESTVKLRVVKEMPSSDQEKAEKISTALKALTEGIKNVDISVTSKLGAGDAYRTITQIEDCNKPGEKMDLVHKAGEVWLVDFWATWCPPCQRPMAHNQEMLTENADAWGGKVRIIGLSIDSDSQTVVKHVESKGWNKVEHYWRSQSDCSKVYGVSGVPHVMLINTEGKIVFKGHPAGRKDLVSDFNLLLKGEKLDCEQTGAEEPKCKDDGAAAKMPEGFSEVDAASINKEMDEFKSIAEKMQKEVGENAKGLQRDYCVMVFESQLGTDGKWCGQYTNHRVLVGAKEKIDACNQLIKDNVRGSFKVEEQVIAR